MTDDRVADRADVAKFLWEHRGRGWDTWAKRFVVRNHPDAEVRQQAAASPTTRAERRAARRQERAATTPYRRMARMKPEKKYRDLPCQLTDEERRERGIKLAATLQEYDRVCDEKASQMSRYKTKIDLLKSQLDDLATVVQNGTEYRQIEVAEEIDYKKGIAEIIRLDTGESVGQRILAESERQIDIQIPAKPAADRDDDQP